MLTVPQSVSSGLPNVQVHQDAPLFHDGTRFNRDIEHSQVFCAPVKGDIFNSQTVVLFLFCLEESVSNLMFCWFQCTFTELGKQCAICLKLSIKTSSQNDCRNTALFGFFITSGKHTRAAGLCEKMKTPLSEMGFVENKQIIKLHGICFLC